TVPPIGQPFSLPIPSGRNPKKEALMAITVAEKEHWKSRIEKKIDRKIELIQRSKPELFQTIKTKARAAALIRLEIDADHDRMAELQTQIDRLQDERKKLVQELNEKLNGSSGSRYSLE